MSIIHDALKKVQHSLERKYGHQATSQEPAQQPQAMPPTNEGYQSAPVAPDMAKQKDVISTKMIFFMANAMLIALGVIIVLVLKLLDTQKAPLAPSPVVATRQQAVGIQTASTPAQPAAVAQPQQTAQQSVAVQEPSVSVTTVPVRKEGLYLNGTMLMDNRRVALINEDIYETGEYVDGKKIVTITLREVSLLNESTGELTTLKVLNRK